MFAASVESMKITFERPGPQEETSLGAAFAMTGLCSSIFHICFVSEEHCSSHLCLDAQVSSEFDIRPPNDLNSKRFRSQVISFAISLQFEVAMMVILRFGHQSACHMPEKKNLR